MIHDRRWAKTRTPRSIPSFATLWLLIAAAPLSGNEIRLTDVTDQTGITFVHTDGSSGQRYIVEFVVGGLATFDYDGDGLIDIYFLNGAPLRGASSEKPPRNALYRNEGNCRFTDVTEHAGVGDTGYGLGVAAGDWNNDGWPDLYVNNFGANVFYRNNGDGTFTDVTKSAGVDNGNRVAGGVSFMDIDNDGNLDLYVSNYVKFTYERHDEITRRGVVVSGPVDFDADPDTLFRSNGDGTFTDVSDESGIAAHHGTGMGLVAADYDNDGDTDLFICNDTMENYFFENDGKGNFEEIALLNGTAFNYSGQQQGSMGADCADYDNDGLLDLFMTNYQEEMPVMYRNLGDGLLEDVTVGIGVGRSAARYVTWGTNLVDLDNDGDRDLFMACGNLTDVVESLDDTVDYAGPNILLMNTGSGKYIDVSRTSGSGLEPVKVSRGTAFDDLDNDGDLDGVVVNTRSTPTVMRNDTAPSGHWLQLDLKGTRCNRDAVGTRVKLVAGDLTLVDEVHSGRSYQSDCGRRLHFGLGHVERVDVVEVRWLGGAAERYRDLPVDRLIRLVQGSGEPVR